MTSSDTQIPAIPLPHPQVLLPNGRLSLLISRSIGDHLLSLVEESSEPTIVAAVPIVTPPTGASDPVFSDYGVAARVVRLGRSSNNHEEHAYHLTVAGLARLHLPHGLHLTAAQLDTLTYCLVEYPPSGANPTRSTLEATKAAAVNLLDKLAKSGPRRDYWSRMMHFVEGIDHSRIVWLADAMASAVEAEFNDKLGEPVPTPPLAKLINAVAQKYWPQPTLRPDSKPLLNCSSNSHPSPKLVARSPPLSTSLSPSNRKSTFSDKNWQPSKKSCKT